MAAAVFASSYHAVKPLPYMGGIVLVAALVVPVSSIHAVAREGQKALTGSGGRFAHLRQLRRPDDVLDRARSTC